MKKILIFGANGFIGSHVCGLLQKKDFRIQKLSSQSLRMQNLDSVVAEIKGFKPDFVLQFAGVVPIGSNILEMYEGNLLPTVRLATALEMCGRRETPVYLLGSAAEYGRTTEIPVDEFSLCNPHTHYGISKHAQTQFAMQAKNDGFCFSVLRLFNVIGAGMKKEQVPQCFIEQLKQPSSSIKTGPIDSVRDFLDVETVAEAVAALLEKNWNGDLVNICSGKAHTPRDLLNEIIRATQAKKKIEENSATQFGTYHNLGCAKKLRSILGYDLEFSSSITIKKMLEQ